MVESEGTTKVFRFCLRDRFTSKRKQKLVANSKIVDVHGPINTYNANSATEVCFGKLPSLRQFCRGLMFHEHRGTFLCLMIGSRRKLDTMLSYDTVTTFPSFWKITSGPSLRCR